MRFEEVEKPRIISIHALMAHVLHLSKSATILYSGGDFVAASVLARVMLEHAIYAQLVAQHPLGFDGLMSVVVKGNRRALRQARQVLNVEPEIAEMYSAVPDYGIIPEFQNFKKVQEAFIESDFLELMYGNLSGHVHPSNSLLNAYAPEGDDSPKALLTPQVSNTGRAPHAIAFSVALSLGAFASRMENPSFAKTVEVAARSLGLYSMLSQVESDENQIVRRDQESEGKEL